jgi:hypothetical protein
VSRLIDAYRFDVEDDDEGGGGEQGTGPNFIEPGMLYSQPTGGAVDFIEED